MYGTVHKVPQFKGLKSGFSEMPDVPLNYLEASAGSPASAKRPTTREPAGPTMAKKPTRQSHSARTMSNGE